MIRGFSWRIAVLIGITLSVLAFVFALPAIPQDPAYHRFADSRSVFGIPNFMNVISNLPFLAAGICGMTLTLRRSHTAAFSENSEMLPFVIFFFGVITVFGGSTFYHLHPKNDTLLWDRLGMSIAFMGILAGIIGDRIDGRAGVFCAVPMVAAGALTVFHWYYSEMRGAGDLRFYAIVQFFTLAAIPILLILLPPRYTHTGWLVAAGSAYVLAKIFEQRDQVFFEAVGISGHTLKHLAAATAAFCVIAMIGQRKLRTCRL